MHELLQVSLARHDGARRDSEDSECLVRPEADAFRAKVDRPRPGVAQSLCFLQIPFFPAELLGPQRDVSLETFIRAVQCLIRAPPFRTELRGADREKDEPDMLCSERPLMGLSRQHRSGPVDDHREYERN